MQLRAHVHEQTVSRRKETFYCGAVGPVLTSRYTFDDDNDDDATDRSTDSCCVGDR